MRIRPADLADAAAIARFHVRSWQETYRGLMPAEFLNNLSIEQRTETWARILGDLASTNFVYVLEDDQENIVGMVSSGAERDEHPDYDAEVYAIYVSHTLHGQGWGRKLFEHSLNDLKQRGFGSMLLWVLKENPSRGFYEHAGGKLLGEREVEFGGAKITEVAYGWETI